MYMCREIFCLACETAWTVRLTVAKTVRVERPALLTLSHLFWWSGRESAWQISIELWEMRHLEVTENLAMNSTWPVTLFAPTAHGLQNIYKGHHINMRRCIQHFAWCNKAQGNVPIVVGSLHDQSSVYVMYSTCKFIGKNHSCFPKRHTLFYVLEVGKTDNKFEKESKVWCCILTEAPAVLLIPDA